MFLSPVLFIRLCLFFTIGVSSLLRRGFVLGTAGISWVSLPFRTPDIYRDKMFLSINFKNKHSKSSFYYHGAKGKGIGDKEYEISHFVYYLLFLLLHGDKLCIEKDIYAKISIYKHK